MAQPRSLSSLLSLRRGASGSYGAAADDPASGRPHGPLIWAHCTTPDRLEAVDDMIARLRADGDRFSVIVTLSADENAPLPTLTGANVLAAPADMARAARSFLDQWKPDVALWLGGPLLPALLAEARKLPMTRILVGPEDDGPLIEGRSWLPGQTRSSLDAFDYAFVADETAGLRLRRAGLPQAKVTVAGPFEPGSIVLPYHERDHRDLVAVLGPRPAWHAADVPLGELAAVIGAQGIASRRSHQLLLILSTPDPDAAEPLLAAQGLTFANRLTGAYPDVGTEVLLTDTSEPGLWYRLAALSYLGGTLTDAPCPDPFLAAALGSGILHGRQIGQHRGHFDRLTTAGASRYVNQPEDLGHAVETLLAPDKTAAMAHAAWEVTSAGAETSNQVMALIRDVLDRAEER